MRETRLESRRARGALLVLLLVGLAAVAAACGSSSSGGEDSPAEVTIGASLPLTGPGAVYGKPMREGLQAGIEAANSSDATGGTKLEATFLDSKAEAGPAVSNARQLLSGDGAIALVSAFTVPPLAQLPIGEREEVPILNGGGNDPSLSGHEWLFNDVLSVAQEEEALLRWMKENEGVESVGVIVANSYTDEGQEEIRNVAEQVFGAGNVTSEVLDEAASDATAAIEKVLAGNPDAVFSTSSGTALELTLKQLADRNAGVKVSTPSNAFALPQSFFTGPLASDLVLSRQAYEPTKEFLAAMGASADEPPSLYAGTYYTLGVMLGQAVGNLNEAGESVSGAAIREQLESQGEVLGCCGKTGFDADHGSTAEVEIVKFPGGKEEVVAKTKPQGGGE